MNKEDQARLIREARAAKARAMGIKTFSRVRLAKMIRVTPGAVQLWEEGKVSPRGTNLLNLAKALDTSPAALGFEAEDLDEEGERLRSESRGERKATYPSLQEFLDEQGDVTDDERAWLMSQRFADGDPGDPGWWATQLLAHRRLFRTLTNGISEQLRRNPAPGDPLFLGSAARERFSKKVKRAASPLRLPEGVDVAEVTENAYGKARVLHEASMRAAPPHVEFASQWLAAIVAREARHGALRAPVRERLLAMRHNAAEITDIHGALEAAIAEDAFEHPEDHGLSPSRATAARGAGARGGKPKGAGQKRVTRRR